MSQELSVPNKGRRQLMLLIGLFLLPPIAAWLAWQYLGEHGVSATTNAGTLISPARPLQLDGLPAAQQLRGRWLYVVFAHQGCDERCQEQLYLTRQVRIAVNKDTPRVKRLLLLDAAPDAALQEKLNQEHPDLLVAANIDEALRASFRGEAFGSSGEQFFLVDPLGNLMMFYPAQTNPKGILRDLQKLLKISQVG